MSIRIFAAAALAAVVFVLPASADARKAKPTYYVALGDSWAAGCVPDAASGFTACPRGGPAGYVPAIHRSLRARNRGLRLKNFGCPGRPRARCSRTGGT